MADLLPSFFLVISDYFPFLMQWALNILKKPVLTINWLYQCCNEHRIVPHESFRLLPFSGLTICVTRIPAGLKLPIYFFSKKFVVILL